MVAPRAGAWIETYFHPEYNFQQGKSPLAQGRGLKLGEGIVIPFIFISRPSRRGVD